MVYGLEDDGILDKKIKMSYKAVLLKFFDEEDSQRQTRTKKSTYG